MLNSRNAKKLNSLTALTFCYTSLDTFCYQTFSAFAPRILQVEGGPIVQFLKYLLRYMLREICAADCWYLYPRQVGPAAAAAVVGRAESLLL